MEPRVSEDRGGRRPPNFLQTYMEPEMWHPLASFEWPLVVIRLAFMFYTSLGEAAHAFIRLNYLVAKHVARYNLSLCPEYCKTHCKHLHLQLLLLLPGFMCLICRATPDCCIILLPLSARSPRRQQGPSPVQLPAMGFGGVGV